MGETTTTNSENIFVLPKIALGIKSQDGDVAYYRVAPDKKISELLKTYCKSKNLKFGEMNFIHNGNRIPATKTPIELGIQDGDEIDAMKPVDGGGNVTFP